MSQPIIVKRRVRKLVSLTLTVLLAALTLPSFQRATDAAAAKRREDQQGVVPAAVPSIAPGFAYKQTNLVSDLPGLASIQDPLLVNPWGVSLTATSPFWVANNGTSTSTLYRETSTTPLVKNPGLSAVSIPGGLPTGTVANTTNDFVLPGPCASAPCAARFLFASITGNITGWNPNAPAAGSTTAVIAKTLTGHVYTGLAIGNNGSANYLYAADFANGKIDVFDSTFTLQTSGFPFSDPTIPTTGSNVYHPFNIQAIGGFLYVTYAKVGPDGRDQEGVGNGYVRRFDFNGVRDLSFAINNGVLNSPWGVTIAPASFGVFANRLLVGNFGEGGPSINAFNATTGAFIGSMQDESGNPIEIDELWDLKFGNGGNGGDPDSLYFSAGIGEEEHGLFGELEPTTATATSLIQFATDNFAIGEGSGHIDITVTRSGDASGSASVNYATWDESQAGHASQKSDYEIATGRLDFAPGETSKTFRVLLVNDNFVEGNEVVNLTLSNPTGAGLGSPNQAELTIIDNDAAPSAANPIDDPTFFVRQHYLDFLNREPDPSGLAFWVNQITSCGTDAGCREVKRINVSAAFFLSVEFQRTGFLVYRAHRAAFGAPPLYGQFMRDTQTIGRGVVVGSPDWEARLEANTQAYFNELVTRPEFVTKYPASMTNEQYVDALLASAGMAPNQVRLFVVNLTNAQEVPPTTPTTSTGAPRPASSGTARLFFNETFTALTLNATVNNIDFTGSQTADANDNLTNAHIHASATASPTTTAPVVWGFIGTPFNDNNPNDARVTPFTSGVGGTVSAKWDAPEGNNTTLTAQLSNLREGRAYINFHTVQFSGGEIRGNIPPATAFRDALVASLNAGTDTRATILRRVAESEEMVQREFNPAFVTMEYFGYLRRDPDQAGLTFWLNKLNAFNGDFIRAEMVKAFLTSSEYRQRFGAS